MVRKYQRKRYNHRKAIIKYRRIKLLRKARAEQNGSGPSARTILTSDKPSGILLPEDGNQTLTLAITTAGRKKSTLLQALKNIRSSGFKQCIHIFAEKNALNNTKIQEVDSNTKVYRNSKNLGCYANWKQMMQWLSQNITTDWFLIMQDDVVWCKHAALILNHAINNISKQEVGFLSPYVSPAMVPNRAAQLPHYWVKVHKRNFWGAVAMCYSKESLYYTVHSKRFLNHKHFRQVDVVAGDVFYRSPDIRWPYIHLPSLVDHIGVKSTIGRDKNPRSQWGRHGYRFNADYIYKLRNARK